MPFILKLLKNSVKETALPIPSFRKTAQKILHSCFITAVTMKVSFNQSRKRKQNILSLVSI